MKCFASLTFSFILCISVSAQELWNVDNAHSNLRFEVGWEDFSVRTGEFKIFNGTIVTDSRDDLSNAKIEFIVDASSVDVIADRLAGHIMSDRFLDVENYPEISFISERVTKTGDDTYTSAGKLTIHGVEKDHEVSFHVKGSKETKKGSLLGLEVTVMVDKTDFGLDWGSPRLADNIKLVGHILYKLEVEEEE